MFNFKNIEKIREYLLSLGQQQLTNYIVKDKYVLTIGGNTFCSIQQIVDTFELKTVYCVKEHNKSYPPEDLGKAIFFERWGRNVYMAWESQNGILSISTLVGYIFCESEDEKNYFLDIEKLKYLQEQCEEFEHFLKDPWEEYNAYERNVSKKLEKIKRSTEWRIADRTKKLPELKKQIDEFSKRLIEKNFLSGFKE